MKKLTSAQDAIKQAIEGGFLAYETDDGKIVNAISFEFEDGSDYDIPSKIVELHYPEDSDVPWEHETLGYMVSDCLLNPKFWQALGKARGYEPKQNMVWKLWAKRWFETRLLNGDETKFWESLP